MTKNEFYSVWNKNDNGHILIVVPKSNKVKANFNAKYYKLPHEKNRIWNTKNF